MVWFVQSLAQQGFVFNSVFVLPPLLTGTILSSKTDVIIRYGIFCIPPSIINHGNYTFYYIIINTALFGRIASLWPIKLRVITQEKWGLTPLHKWSLQCTASFWPL
jgi:hypothetical protein